MQTYTSFPGPSHSLPPLRGTGGPSSRGKSSDDPLLAENFLLEAWGVGTLQVHSPSNVSRWPNERNMD